MSDPATLLPPNATPRERRIEAVIARLGAVDTHAVGELWNPQTCPLDLLPWLAWALGVDHWRSTWSEAQKRRVVASAPEVRRLRGTVGAVRRAISAVMGDAQVDVLEWFTPAGTGLPFREIVKVDFTGADRAQADALTADVTQAIETAKPLRSRVQLQIGSAYGVKLAPVALLRKPAMWSTLAGEARVVPLFAIKEALVGLLRTPIVFARLTGTA